jgi:hypothetical protein
MATGILSRPAQSTLGLDAPSAPLTRKPWANKAHLVAAATESARKAIGTLVPGGRIVGVTKGQFSLLNVIYAMLEQTGPAHLTFSTWRMGLVEAELVKKLSTDGDILSVRFLMDRSFARCHPEYAPKIEAWFGKEAIRTTQTHAKFALLRNGTWNICVRGSFNLNASPRFEQFDLDDDATICDFFADHVQELWDSQPPGFGPSNAVVRKGFVAAMGGGVSSVYSLEQGEGQEPDSLAALLAELNR